MSISLFRFKLGLIRGVLIKIFSDKIVVKRYTEIGYPIYLGIKFKFKNRNKFPSTSWFDVLKL